MLNYLNNQISVADSFSECAYLFKEEPPAFIQLLSEYINISDYISYNFKRKFYSDFGRPREYPLYGFISALVLKNIFKIPDDPLLIIFLNFSPDLRKFCGFSKVPDKTQLSKFRTSYVDELQKLFDSLVDITEPICQAIDPELAAKLSYDTTAVESCVTENNPKFLNTEIRKLKGYYKFKKIKKSDSDIHKQAYSNMPKFSSADKSIRKMYANGHFCYGRKFGIITNGLGIPRHIASLDDDFKDKHPDSIVTKDELPADSPDTEKTVSDSKSLIPVLTDFYNLHPNFKHSDFLGDSAFDNDATYKYLLLKDEFGNSLFNRAFIPLNLRGTKTELGQPSFNEAGIPLCPKDHSLKMIANGKSPEKGHSTRHKFICPKSKREGGTFVCKCEDPCTDSKYGRVVYVYPEKDLRMYPGIFRDSDIWASIYKIRGTIEQAINHIKVNMAVAARKTRNLKTVKADVLLAGISMLFTVILADKIGRPEYIRSLKPLAC